MIKSLTVKNFKSHLKTTVNFDELITVLNGESLSGKTDLIRALRFLVYNRPSKRVKVTNRENPDEDVSVIGKFSPGGRVRLMKTKKGSASVYQAGDQKYKKHGTKVPEDVSEVIALKDINFQGQFDEPYLITSPASQISQVVNRVISAEDSNRIISEFNSEISDINKNIDRAELDLEKIDEREKEEQALLPLKEIHENHRKLESTAQDLYSKLEKIIEMVDIHDKAVARINECNQKLKARKHLDEFELLREEVNSLKRKQELIRQHINLTFAIETFTGKLSEATDKYVNALKKAGVCETCYGEIDEAAIARIRDNL